MLDNLQKIGKNSAKRIGRGYGSKKGGHTSTRGMKGQRSRSGYKIPRPGFEGGQMPLSRRLPKLKGFSRGFATANISEYVLDLNQLDSFENNTEVTIETLIENKIVPTTFKKFSVKVLGGGSITKKVNLVGVNVSKSAREAIEKAGGSVK